MEELVLKADAVKCLHELKDMCLDTMSETSLRSYLECLKKALNSEKPKNGQTPNDCTPCYITPDIPLGVQKYQDDDFFQYAHWIGSLKHTKRTGWLLDGVLPSNAEPIGAHMYRMAMLCFAGYREIESACDVSKVIEMCLVHDVAEAIVGDIPPCANVPKSEKHKLEENAMVHLQQCIGTSPLKALWDHYEAQDSREAVFVKDLDRFDMILQAYEYELEYGVDLSSYFDSTKGFFKTEMVKRWDSELRKRRLEAIGRL